MDFKDKCKQLAERVTALKEMAKTEEATKNALIMPFIQMLGYDVFNPLEVVPEMDCDLVKKKGEKIDYAIIMDGEPVMLFECKHWEQNLDLHATQLQKYFVASKAKFGVLTNGILYRFYTDLVRENIMDDVPFLEINMERLRDAHIEELKKFHKSYFSVDDIMCSANELKYMSELKAQLKAELAAPSQDFARLLAKRVYDGVVSQKVLDMFTELIQRAAKSYINDILSDRLNIAITQTEQDTPVVAPKQNTTPIAPVIADDNTDSKIVTTEEELQGYYIVKAIVRNILPAERVAYRDAQTYFTIIADDNNRKLICRLYFNGTNKYMKILWDGKEVRYDLNSLDDLYNYADELIKSAKRYVD